MVEMDNLTALEHKLQGVCDDNGLIYQFLKKQYPVMLRILPDATLDMQMSLLEQDTRPNPSGSSISYIFRGEGLLIRSTGGFELPEPIMNKLKNLAKKLHYAWLQVFFAQRMCDRAGPPAEAFDDEDFDPIDVAEFDE